MANKFFYTTNITLVCEVKKYKCLYDFTRSDYTNRKMVEDAWAEIGKKLGVSGNCYFFRTVLTMKGKLLF